MGRTLKACLALFKIRAAEGLQYRLAGISSATIGIFWALIEIVVLTVFFRYGSNTADSVNGISLAQSVSYIWLAQVMVALNMGIDGDLLKKITSGDIGVELCRPLDLYWHWFARFAAGKTTHLVIRGGLEILCGAALTVFGARSLGLGLPYSGVHFLLFLVSFFCAYLFNTAFGMLMTAVRTGITWGDGPLNLIMVTGQILSGVYLPLQLWPDFMQVFLRLQPFAGSLDTSARLYVGSVSLETGLLLIMIQIIWSAAFIFLGKMIMKNKLKTIVVQGG